VKKLAGPGHLTNSYSKARRLDEFQPQSQFKLSLELSKRTKRDPNMAQMCSIATMRMPFGDIARYRSRRSANLRSEFNR
jgi:hypothetical protein